MKVGVALSTQVDQRFGVTSSSFSLHYLDCPREYGVAITEYGVPVTPSNCTLYALKDMHNRAPFIPLLPSCTPDDCCKRSWLSLHFEWAQFDYQPFGKQAGKLAS